MLTKTPKSGFKRFVSFSLKTVFIVEAAAFAASYACWYRLNTNRDFRLYMYKNHNWLLEGYYALGEKFSDQQTRELDQVVWAGEGKI